MEKPEKKTTLIRTFADDIYIIEGKTPKEVQEAIEGMDDVEMPNGAIIHRKSIASMQSYADYSFQTEQRVRHKRGQYLHGGRWHHPIEGSLGINAHLERITGELAKQLPAGAKKLKP